MAGSAGRTRWNGADRLTASASSHLSGEKSSTGAKSDHGIVDEDVDAAKAFQQFAHHGFNGSSLRKIGSDTDRIDAEARFEAVGRLSRCDEIVQDKVRSGSRQAFRNRKTKTCGRPGHESPFA
jgi:hypothetical protein